MYLPGFAQATAGLVPTSPVSVSATQNGLNPEVTVSWQPSAGAAATGASVGLWGQTLPGIWQQVAGLSCTASCSSITFRYLKFGTVYEAAVWLTNSAGAAPAVASNQVTLNNRCPVGICVNVDSGRAIEPASHQASGILNSMNGSAGDASMLGALQVSDWRASTVDWTGSIAPWSAAASEHVPNTFVLSDKWSSDTGGSKITPWSDWNQYRNWVTWSVQELTQGGLNVDYWEVYNEPDAMPTWYYPQAEAQTVTADNLLTQFLVTYQAIKAVLPNAQIIGPSFATWEENPTSQGFSMAQFLDYAAANNMSLAAVSWHFNENNPLSITDQVSEARNMIAARPALGQPKIFINEFGAEALQRIPGWDVQYLSALTNGKVDNAGRSCWVNDCTTPVLDGLLASDGSSTLPDYWVRWDYAQMTGNMVATSTSSDNSAAIASYDPSKSQMNVLFGWGVGCVQDLRCLAIAPWAISQPPIQSQLTVEVPWSSGHVAVSVSHIAGNAISPLGQPAVGSLGIFPITLQGGVQTVTVNLGTTSDGDAWNVVLNHVA